jgi:hypothetical protein
MRSSITSNLLGAGLGAHPPRLQGRPVVHQRSRRLLLRSDPGRGESPNTSAQLRVRGCASRRAARSIATGTLVVPVQGKGQSVEMQAERSRWSAGSTTPRPTRSSPSATRMEYLREVAHLRPRTNLIGAVTRVRTRLAQAVHRFFTSAASSGSTRRSSPLSDAEGAGQMFRVSTLDMANLPRTQEGKVDLEPGLLRPRGLPDGLRPAQRRDLLPGAEKVYTFGPTFRAENSNTRRHLAEFWMIEPEIAFADLNDDADAGRGVPEVHLQGRARRARRRPGVLRRARREGPASRAEKAFIDAVRAHRLHRGDRDAGEERQEVRVPGRSGASTCRPSTSASSDRGARRPPGGGDELPQGDQGLLHAPERRRRPSPRWTCWRPASARSSAAASARSASTCSTRA